MTVAASAPAMAQNSAAAVDERPRASKLASLTLHGFLSFAKLEDFQFNNLNILIGANGAGKSNLLAFFEMLGWMIASNEGVGAYISRKGGANSFLFNGAKHTPEMRASLKFASDAGENQYEFGLERASDDRFFFCAERYRFCRNGLALPDWQSLGAFGSGRYDAAIRDETHVTAFVTKQILSQCWKYQFHDTSDNSRFTMPWDTTAFYHLRQDGGNLAAVLLQLQEDEPHRFGRIENAVRFALPDFAGFELHPRDGQVALGWKTKGVNSMTFGANRTSDGTLRLFALLALLMMPADRMPDIMLIDEPELGLHPSAIYLVASLIKTAARMGKQLIIATQSPLLVDEFSPEDIIVAKRDAASGTALARLDIPDLDQWLEEYRLGDLWRQNIIEANPL